MTTSVWILLLIMASMMGATALILFWTWRSGQWEDVEDIKYRMLQDE